MLHKCANPDCSEKFLFLHQGKLFCLAPTPEVVRTSPAALLPLQERFWLCDRCSETMTVIWSGAQAKVIPLPPHAAKAAPQMDRKQAHLSQHRRAAHAGADRA